MLLVRLLHPIVLGSFNEVRLVESICLFLITFFLDFRTTVRLKEDLPIIWWGKYRAEFQQGPRCIMIHPQYVETQGNVIL